MDNIKDRLRALDNPDLALEIIWEYSLDHADRDALALADDVLKRFPESRRLQALRANELLHVGELEKAVRAMEEPLREGLGDPIILALGAEIDGYLGDIELAGQRVRSALVLAPENALVLQKCASIARFVGNEEFAEGIFISYRKVRSDDELSLSTHATHLRMADPKRMEEVEDILIKKFPDSVSAHKVHARRAIASRDLSGAKSAYERALAIRPQLPTLLAEYSTVLKALGLVDETERAALSSIELNKRSPVAWRNLAWVARQRGDKKLAAIHDRASDEAIPLLKVFAVTHKANALVRLGKNKDALAVLSAAEGHFDEWARTTIRKSKLNLLLDMNLPDELEVVVSELYNAGWRIPAVYVGLSKVFATNGGLSEAEAACREGLKEHAANSLLTAELIRVLHLQGRHDAVSEIIERLSKGPPNDPMGCMKIFTVIEPLGYVTQSHLFLAACREKFPGDPTLKLGEAVARLSLGDFEGASKASEGIGGDQKQLADMTKKAASLLDKLNRLFPRR